VIDADIMQDMYTWVDTSYGIHDDLRSQTGEAMSFGEDFLHHKSSVHDLNTKSSIEAEVVGTEVYIIVD